MALAELSFVIHGTPAPKGSMRAAGNRVIPSGSPQNAHAQADWGSAVRAATAAAMRSAGHADAIPFVAQAIALRVVWRMKRPRAHFVEKGPLAGRVKATAPLLCTVAPDNSKLLRALEDHFNRFVWDDDSRVAVSAQRKIYADPGHEGATVQILALDPRTGQPIAPIPRETQAMLRLGGTP